MYRDALQAAQLRIAELEQAADGSDRFAGAVRRGKVLPLLAFVAGAVAASTLWHAATDATLPPPRPEAALESCRSDDPEACFHAGLLMEADWALADTTIRVYARACRMGHAESCFRQGTVESRRGAPTAGEGAFRVGCEMGSAAACGALASLYER